MPQAALKFETEVLGPGRIEIDVPLAPGSRVVVFVIEEPVDDDQDMLAAAQTSLGFWDNPLDDEDWNDA